MTKKSLLAIFIVAVLFLTSAHVLAAGEPTAMMAPVNNFGLVIKLLTLILVGVIIYSLWVGLSEFGGTLGGALKVVGLGILLISLHVLDEVLSTLTGYGSEMILGGVLSSENFHGLMALVGFVVLAVGLAKMSKVVKSMKG